MFTNFFITFWSYSLLTQYVTGFSCVEETPSYFDGHCLPQCPVGTYPDWEQNCVCDKSCGTCSYYTQLKSQCNTCSKTYQFLSGPFCVNATDCPVYQFADPLTKSCVSSCPIQYPLTNKYSRMCSTTCDSNLIQLVNDCIDSCPSTYFESNGQCQACVSPCVECTNLLFCTSCITPLMPNELTGSCDSACADGFFYIGGMCRVCQQKCSTCPQNYFVSQDQVCVQSCDIGYNPVNGICVPQLNPIVTIINKKLIPIGLDYLRIGRKNDLKLEVQYILRSGKINNVKWSLQDSTQEASFFNLTANGFLFIIIPSKNLETDTTYYVKVELTTDLGGTGNDMIQLKTSWALSEGKFDVFPKTGVAGKDTFKISYTNWNTDLGVIQYQLIHFQQKYLAYEEEKIQITEQPTLISNSQDNEVKYIFPYQVENQITYTLQLQVFTDFEQVIKTLTVKIIQSAPTENQLNDLKGDLLKNLNGMNLPQILSIVQIMNYLYNFNRTSQIDQIYQVNLLKTNYLLHYNQSICKDTLQCRGLGQCTTNQYDKSAYQCNCYWGMQGDYCTWESDNLIIVNSFVTSVLQEIQNIAITEQNIMILSQIAIGLVSSLDALSLENYQNYANFIQQLLTLKTLNEYSYTNIINAVSTLLFLTCDRQGISPQDKMHYSLLFGDILNEIIKNYEEYSLQVNTIKYLKNPYLTILFVKSGFIYIQERFGTTSGSVIFSSDKSVIEIELNQNKEEYVIMHSLQWNIDPICINTYSSSISNQFEVVSYETREQFQNQSYNISLMKITAYPPMLHQYPYLYTCNMYNSTNLQRNSDRNQNCTFIGENLLFYSCKCSSFGFVSVYTNMIDFTGETPLQSIVESYSQSENVKQETQYSNDLLINTTVTYDKSLQPYSPIQIIIPEESFEWVNIALWVMCILCGLYVLLTLIIWYLYRTDHISKDIIIQKEILLLTFHPLISIRLLGQNDNSPSYYSRFSKFFVMLIGYFQFLSIGYRQFSSSDRRTSQINLWVSSVFFSLLMTTLCQYFLESLYHIIKSQKINPYFLNFLLVSCLQILLCPIAIYEHGFISSTYNGTYIINAVIIMVIDLLIIDPILVCYAHCANQNDAFLRLLAFKGFFMLSGHLYEKVPEELSQAASVSIVPEKNDQDREDSQMFKSGKDKLENLDNLPSQEKH